jgi:hypothetical protein
MGDWRAKQRALRKYEYDAPPSQDRRGPSGAAPAAVPVRGPGGGGRQGGAAAAVPATVEAAPVKAIGRNA